jgi:hypothetical protein
MSYPKRTGDWVDNGPIREAVLSSQEDLSTICRRLGYVNGIKPDTTRLQRRLGATATTGNGRYGRRSLKTRTIRYDIAVRIIEAINRDPVDFDL